MAKSMERVILAIAHQSIVTLVSRLSEKGILSRGESVEIFEDIGACVENLADVFDQPGDPQEMEDIRKRVQDHANQYYDVARGIRALGA